jgi:diphthamide synthase (EF-2-diphthine--ammonia ligase)
MERKTLLSWSSGKDSAWALYKLQQDSEIEVVGLFCTVNQEFDRVAMHGVRRELLELQAERVGLPLEVIAIPYPCSNNEYEMRMAEFIDQAKLTILAVVPLAIFILRMCGNIEKVTSRIQASPRYFRFGENPPLN